MLLSALRAVLLCLVRSAGLCKPSNDERSGLPLSGRTLCDTVRAMTSSSGRRSGPTRRAFLVGSGLAVLGAGGGVAVGLLVDRSPEDVDVPSPRTLVAAASAERVLLAQVDAALANDAALGPLLRQVRADHVAHLAAITAAMTLAIGGAPPSTTSTTPAPLPAAFGHVELRAAEAAAGSAAAQRALSLSGDNAAMLASISACEATHAELLS